MHALSQAVTLKQLYSCEKTSLLGLSLRDLQPLRKHAKLGLMLRFLVFGFLLFMVCGCASTSEGEGPTIGFENVDEGNTAHGAAYVTDAFHVRRGMSANPEWKPMEFLL